MSNKQKAIELLEYLIKEVKKDNVDVTDLGYGFSLYPIEKEHLTKPEVERFYNGEKDIKINLCLFDKSLQEKEGQRYLKWLKDE